MKTCTIFLILIKTKVTTEVIVKRIIKPVVAIIAALIFILFPIKPADLILKLTIEGTDAGLCRLYYSTTETDFFNEEMSLPAQKTNTVNLYDFKIPSDVAGDLKMIRLDFPSGSVGYAVTNVTVYSGGVTRKYYNPDIFFAPGNVVAYADLTYGSDESTDFIYVTPTGPDPNLVFSELFTNSLKKCQSRFYLTRIFIVCFIAAAWLISTKKARLGS